MKFIRKILLLTGVLMVLMLAGCTGNIGHIAVNTTLTVDTSFKGSRVMTADIPASAFRFAFGGDVDALEAVISKYTPGDMYCIADTNDDGGARIEMHIDFASRNEYQKKIEKICEGNTSDTAVTPVINFDYSRSMLKNGYTIEENFTSLDLFYWLADALVKEYPALGDKEVGDIFELGTTEVVFNGESLAMNGYIQISTIKSNAFDSIAVSAELNDDQSVDAEITYVVSNKVVAALGTKLETLMNSLVSENAELSYQDSDSDRTYMLTFHSNTIQGYISNVNKALHTNDTVFEVTTEGDTESLAAKKSIKQYYNGSFFLDFTDDNTVMAYILKVSPDYTVESCKGTYGYLRGESSAYSEDSCEITMTVASSDEVVTVLGFAVDIDEVDIITDVHSSNNIERSIEFRLLSDADALIGSSIEERLNSAASRWPDEGKMSVDKQAVISSVTYRILLSADSPEELTAMTLDVLGQLSEDESGGGELTDSLFTGGIEKHKNPWKINCSFEDTLNLSMFLKGSQVTKGIHYKLTYPRGFNAAFAENNMFEDAAVDGASITCSSYNKIMTVKSTAQKVNIQGIIIFGIWIVSIICLMVLIILNLSHLASLVVNKKLDIPGQELFKGRNLTMLTIGVIAVVCFAIMSIRLLFRVY